MPLRLGKAAKATAFNERALQHDDDGDQDAALRDYIAAARAHPQWAVPWFNAGLIHKYRGHWAASLDANAEAVRRDAQHAGAVWNLGIAATALGDWATARKAWRLYGIDVPEGDGPIDFPIGPVPLRLHGTMGSEIVWADRIDPARAVLRGLPTPASGFAQGDTVLHDGAANGHVRNDAGRDVPVFDALQLLARYA